MTDQERKFLTYWEHHRDREKRLLQKIWWGIPSGVIFSSVILFVFISGWDKQVPLISVGLFVTIVIGLIVVALFYAYMKMQVRWERNEHLYQVLKKKYT